MLTIAAYYAFNEPLKEEREERIAEQLPTESAIRLQEQAQAGEKGVLSAIQAELQPEQSKAPSSDADPTSPPGPISDSKPWWESWQPNDSKDTRTEAKKDQSN